MAPIRAGSSRPLSPARALPPAPKCMHPALVTVLLEQLVADQLLHPRALCSLLLQSLRLVIKDSKKHVGEKLVMAFVEYSNTYFATEAMDALQVGGWVGGQARMASVDGRGMVGACAVSKGARQQCGGSSRSSSKGGVPFTPKWSPAACLPAVPCCRATPLTWTTRRP